MKITNTYASKMTVIIIISYIIMGIHFCLTPGTVVPSIKLYTPKFLGWGEIYSQLALTFSIPLVCV